MTRKYHFILETIAGLALLAAIDLLLVKESGAFVGVHPHPFWIVVLLIASRYGLGHGLFAGGTAGIAYVVFGSSTVDFSGVSFPHGPYIMPFMFLLVGGILGQIRTIFKKQQADVQERFDATRDDYELLNIEHQALTTSKWELDKRIALQSTTMVSLFEQLTRLDHSDPNELYAKVPELLHEQLNVTCSSVYLIINNELRLAARTAESSTSLPDVLNLDEGMVGESISRKQAIAINRGVGANDMTKFSKHAMNMCAPIIRKNDAIVGIIIVERMPFFDFTANAVKVFETLVQWVSIAVEQALQFQHFKDKNIADEITGAYNYLHFQKRLTYEIARARRFRTSLSLVLMEIKLFDRMQESEQNNILTVLNWIFSNILRDTDIIAKYKKESTFAIILPGQSSEDCEAIIERISAEVRNYELRPFDTREDALQFVAGVSTLQLTDGSYKSMVTTAEDRLHRGGGLNQSDVYDDIQYLLNFNREE